MRNSGTPAAYEYAATALGVFQERAIDGIIAFLDRYMNPGA